MDKDFQIRLATSRWLWPNRERLKEKREELGAYGEMLNCKL